MDQTRIDGSPHAISAVFRRAGLAVGAIGAIVLLGGWVFGIENLKSAGSSITMKTNAALCLALSGVSLWCLSRERLRALGVLSAATVGLIAAATLSEHIFQIDLGLDQLFFSEPPGAAATVSPNRMGVNASFSLLLESIAILSLYQGTVAHVVRAQMLAAGASILAIVPIVGYIYGAQELFALARLTGIAWPTAFSLLLLSQGVLFARLDAGPITPLVGKGAGATMARRMWGPALVLPFVLGYLQVAGQRAGVYDTGFGTALFSICVAAALWFTLWRTAIVLDRVDVERSKALAREHRARLDAEQQEDSTPTRAYGGLGLGLTIVKDLTALHGGVVTAESQGRGEGTTMTIELPLA